MYKVIWAPSSEGVVYSIQPLETPDKVQHVHATMLKPVPVNGPPNHREQASTQQWQ